jgi:hypothetical protein
MCAASVLTIGAARSGGLHEPSEHGPCCAAGNGRAFEAGEGNREDARLHGFRDAQSSIAPRVATARRPFGA